MTAWFCLVLETFPNNSFFDNITYNNMYSKSRAVTACRNISHTNVTIALLLASGERLTAEFRPEGDRLSTTC